MNERELLAQRTTMLRRAAVEGFHDGVEDLIAELRRYAAAAENAIGEISVDEAWAGLRRIVDEKVPTTGV